jgi:SAM-dependent methyltransferase
MTALKCLTTDGHYPAVLRLFRDKPKGNILDVPAGQGAFAQELVKLGFGDIHCLDINAEAFLLRHPQVHFTQHDVINPLPFPDAHFDYVFSIEGIEHFLNPCIFALELCRVLKPGGTLYISTPNTFSVDARLKYLTSGYFPRFRTLMLDPGKLMLQPMDDNHVSPIYFWQLNYVLMEGRVSIARVGANALLRKPRWLTRVFENGIARIIRNNIKRRGFPDQGVTSDAVLFGDCIIVEGVKAA